MITPEIANDSAAAYRARTLAAHHGHDQMGYTVAWLGRHAAKAALGAAEDGDGGIRALERLGDRS